MLKRKKQIIAKVMATTMLAATFATTFATTNVSAAEIKSITVSSSKISGGDRYKTAVAISKQLKPSTANNAVIVNGQKGVVDALTATSYASLKNDAPILMTQNNKLNVDTKAELQRLKVKTVDIIGGTASVSDSVKKEIQAMGITVNRIAGANKYETGLKVAKEIDKMSDITEVAVANADVLADPVSIAAPAAQNEMPIILASPKNGLDKATKDYLNSESISKSYIVGGTSSVSSATQSALPGTKVRLDGGNRPDTNAEIIDQFYKDTNLGNIYVAKSGQINKEDEIVDALAAGVLAAKYEEPLMLVGKSLSSGQRNLLEDKEFTKTTEIGDGISASTISAIKDTQDSSSSGGSTSGDTINTDTVSELEDALDDASNGDVINFDPYSTVYQSITLRTAKDITVNLEGRHTGNITVDMERATLNIKDDIDATVYAEDIERINVDSGVIVDRMQIQSDATDAVISVRGTVRTLDVSASSVEIIGNGNINTLNKRSDTDTSDFDGKIGATDSNTNTSNVVGSMTSLNSKQVTIKFNKAIDKNSIIESNNTLANGRIIFKPVTPESNVDTGKTNSVVADASRAELSEDGRTLTITAIDKQYFKGNYNVEVDKISSNGVMQDKYIGTLNVNDTARPSVNSVVFNASTNKFEVSLSEPIDSLDKNKLVLNLNKNINISAVAWNDNGDKFTFAKPSTGVNFNTTASVYIDGLKDAIGNTMIPYTNNVSIQNSALTVSVSQLLDNKIRLTFNKEVNDATGGKSVTSAIQILDTNSSPITGSATKVDAKTYDVALSNVVYNSYNTRSITLRIDADQISDVTGTKNAKIEQTVNLNKDITAPTITSVKPKTDNTGLEVTLSEDVQNLNASKVKLFKGDGISVPVLGVEIDSDNKKLVRVNTSSPLTDGTYQVKFEDSAVKDMNTNYNKLMETSKITIKNTVSTDYKIEGITSTSNSNIFDVKYTGDMDDEKISYKNFMLNNKEIHSASKIEVNNAEGAVNGIAGKTIRVTLPSEDSVVTSGNATFKVTGLRLKLGQILADSSDVFVVKDNTAPTLTSAEAKTTSNKLVLTFDENIANIADTTTLSNIIAAVKITTGTNNKIYTGANDTATVTVENGNQVVITITPATNSEWNTIKSDSMKVSVVDGQNIIKDNDSISARKVDDKVVTKTYN